MRLCLDLVQTARGGEFFFFFFFNWRVGRWVGWLDGQDEGGGDGSLKGNYACAMADCLFLRYTLEERMTQSTQELKTTSSWT